MDDPSSVPGVEPPTPPDDQTSPLVDPPASLFVNKPQDVKQLVKQDSLMEDVRRRLKTSTQAFMVPGVSRNEDGLERPGGDIKYKLKPRTLFGRVISVSFRNLLLCGITTVMALTMIALLTTQIVISRDVSNSLITSCNDAAVKFLNTTATIILQNLVYIAREQIAGASVDMQVYLMSQAQAQVGSMSNFISASQIDRNINSNLTSFNETRIFISGQVKATYSSWIDSVSIGMLSENQYLDAALCHEEPGGVKFFNPESSVGVCPFSVGTTNQTTLIRCYEDFPLAPGVVTGCRDYQNFSVANQLPVIVQRNFSAVEPANSTALLMWSPPSVIEGFQYELRGALTNMMGIGLSYPVFTNSCQNYSCATTFVWASVTSRSFAAFCRSQVEPSNAFQEYRIAQNDSIFYVVEGRGASTNGILLGGAFGVAEADLTIVPSVPEPAAESTVEPIAVSARFLISQFGSFENQSLDSIFLDTFDPRSLESCNETISSLLASQLGNCTLVAAISVYSPETAPMFRTLEPARLVLVFSIPLKNLLDPLAQQLLEAQRKVNEQREAQEKAIQSLIGVGIGIAIGAILIGIGLAWVMAVRVTVPLGRLSKKMRNLINFNFKVAEADYLSRVSDISHAEQTLESLSDAIQVFSKFVPGTVVRGIVQGRRESTMLHVEHRVVTVAFSDIKGFTSISEKLEISDLLFFLTRYLTVMTEVVEQYEGTVTEILGDGLLVLWNAPDDCEMHSAKACAAALAMQEAVKHVANEFHTILSMHGLENLSIRVGIHTGKVLAGNIGSATKLKYGCLGDTVNTASRLEGLCKPYNVGVICSKDTVDMFPNGALFQCRELDLVQVKGKDNPLALYEVQALREKVLIPRSVDPNRPENEGTVRPFHSWFNAKASLMRIPAKARGVKRATRTSSQPRSVPSTRTTSTQDGRGSVRSFGPIMPSANEADFSSALDRRQELSRTYEDALHKFQLGDFTGAIAVLNQIDETERDAAVKLLLHRCDEAIQAQERGELDLATWKGINRLTEKF